MECRTCKHLTEIDTGKKKKVKNCNIGLTATKKFLQYCGGYVLA